MQGLVLVKSSGHCFKLAHLVSAFQNVCPMVNRNMLAVSKNGWAWPNAAMELLSRIVGNMERSATIGSGAFAS